MNRLLVILLSLACFSCASERAWLTAGDSAYPISLTRSIVDAEGEVFEPSPSEIVESFERSWRHWQWLGFDLTADDLGGVVVDAIEAASGDGVVNLRVTVVNPTGYLTALLLVFPTSVRVTVEGDVFRRGPPQLGTLIPPARSDS